MPTLDTSILKTIQDDLKELISTTNHCTPAEWNGLSLGDSFPIWILPSDNFLRQKSINAALETGYYHHQVEFNGVLGASAMSDEKHQVVAFNEEPLRFQLPEALTDISNIEIRLLTAPAALVRTIWFLSEGKTLGLLMPEKHDLQKYLKSGMVLTLEDYTTRLLDELKDKNVELTEIH